MKKLVYGIVFFLLLTAQVLSSEKTVKCHLDVGGYDDEWITLKLESKKVKSLTYESFQGEVGPFIKVNDSLFEYSSSELILNHIISISNDFKMASLTAVYKNNGNVLSSDYFNCL